MPFCFAKHDPGPCPVDDTPHTACTSVDYVAPDGSRPLVVTTIRRPFTLPAPDPEPETFTTVTYSRSKYRGRRNAS